MLNIVNKKYWELRRQFTLLLGRYWNIKLWTVPRSVRQKCIYYLRGKAEKLFFILGTGRSGTQLLTDLLVQSSEIAVFHEPNFASDVGDMDALRRSKSRCLEYWRGYRSIEIYKRWQASKGALLYGEVNGTIRFHAPAIRELYPDAQLFLVSRDGRGVVRSVMGWPQFYSSDSKGAYAIGPMEGDPYAKRWDEMTRFEKICWAWMDSNEFMMRYVPEDRWLQLERLASDYEYCVNRLFAPLGISMTNESWLGHVSKKSRNASKSYLFPEWSDWSAEQKRAFEEICGETMAKLGYEI